MTDKLTLTQLRGKLTENQSSCLNIIWRYYREKDKWIPTRVLHQQLVKSKGVQIVQELGGSIVYITQDTYRLTPLGVYLTDEGRGAEELITKYIEFIKEKFLDNPEIDRIEGKEVESGLGLNQAQCEILKEILWMSSAFTSGGSKGRDGWSYGLPRNVDDLPEMNDVRSYVLNEIVKYYDPDYPIDEYERSSYMLSPKKEDKDNFWFVIDNLLRQQLTQDWNEALNVAECQAWKSCVILCGGILEGLLWDILNRLKQEAFKAFVKLRSKNPPSELNRWNLGDLVDVADNLGIISKTAFHLSHAIREYRNLVHPGKQIRENISVTKDEADIALNSVRVFLRQLSDYCS